MDGIRTYGLGVNILRIFRQHGREWMATDDLAKLLQVPPSRLVKGVPTDDLSVLERGLSIVAVERGVKLAFLMRSERAREVAKWLLVDVIPHVYTTDERRYGSTVTCNVERR